MNIGYSHLIKLLSLALLFVPATVMGQSETEETPTVPYFRSSNDFNIPIITGWENNSTDTVGLFSNPAASAEIEVSTSDVTDAQEAIEEHVSTLLGTETPESDLSNRINIANGTWNILIFEDGDTTVSSYGLVDKGHTITMNFIEDSPDARIILFAVQEDSADPQVSAGSALQMIYGEAPESEILEESDVELPSGTWRKITYDPLDGVPLTVMVLRFENASYVTVVEGDASSIEDISNAFNTVFLGYFTTPDNTAYLYLGLAASFIVLILLILSFWWRYRNARKDLTMLQTLESSEG